ncbi:hypothetical protein ACH0B5_02300 [Ureibacillus sp. 179-F W5.1 NHS]|nr:hypothetical protein [Lysinibacillus halotolerans]
MKNVTLFEEVIDLSFSGVPSWFFMIVIIFAIVFIIISEWNSRS